MLKIEIPFRTIAAVLCVVMPGTWLSNASVADVIVFGSGGNQFNMEFETVHNPNNPADNTGEPNPAGSVGYQYDIGKFEVSEDMINKYNANFGAANGLVISIDNRGANMPATNVSWNEAARFVNWLSTSTGGFAAYKFITSGVNDFITPWTPADTLDYNASNPFRSVRTSYALPTVDEWYKAAFYDPNTGLYYDFATGSNAAPTPVASGTAPGTAVYDGQLGPADVMLAGGLSPYDVMGLGGNVYEWGETAFSQVNNSGLNLRGIRGGYWANSSFDLSSSVWFPASPASDDPTIGFRVVKLSIVPEPSSWVLTMVGISGLLLRNRMRKSSRTLSA